MKPKLMVIGHGRHGKDTVCEMFREHYNLQFKSSSLAAAEIAIFPILKDLLGYRTSEECYEDRHNHRSLWFELIRAFNYHDRSKLARAIYEEADIYCGIRNRDEFLAIRDAGLFDWSIWVDASSRVPDESTSSCTVTREDADYVIDNNGDLSWLERQVHDFMAWREHLLLTTFGPAPGWRKHGE